MKTIVLTMKKEGVALGVGRRRVIRIHPGTDLKQELIKLMERLADNNQVERILDAD